jgi:hypothetical protein
MYIGYPTINVRTEYLNKKFLFPNTVISCVFMFKEINYEKNFVYLCIF